MSSFLFSVLVIIYLFSLSLLKELGISKVGLVRQIPRETEVHEVLSYCPPDTSRGEEPPLLSSSPLIVIPSGLTEVWGRKEKNIFPTFLLFPPCSTSILQGGVLFPVFFFFLIVNVKGPGFASRCFNTGVQLLVLFTRSSAKLLQPAANHTEDKGGVESKRAR